MLALEKLPCVTFAMMPFASAASDAKSGSWVGKSNPPLCAGFSSVCEGKLCADAHPAVRMSTIAERMHAT